MNETKIGSTSQRREGDVDSIVMGKPATVAQNIYGQTVIIQNCGGQRSWFYTFPGQ